MKRPALAEARRLLAPGGVIFADAFTSPLVAREAGSRYAVECDREHLLKLAAMAGLKAEVVMESMWNGQARRGFLKFMPRMIERSHVKLFPVGAGGASAIRVCCGSPVFEVNLGEHRAHQPALRDLVLGPRARAADLPQAGEHAGGLLAAARRPHAAGTHRRTRR